MNIKRYVSGAFGMIPADDGEWVMWSELEPVVKRLYDISLALVVAESKSAELEAECRALQGASDAMEGLADKYHDENLIARDLLRWRKVGEEMPSGMCLVMASGMLRLCRHDAGGWYWDGDSLMGVTHWRPIGPLPTTTEGEKP